MFNAQLVVWQRGPDLQTKTIGLMSRKVQGPVEITGMGIGWTALLLAHVNSWSKCIMLFPQVISYPLPTNH